MFYFSSAKVSTLLAILYGQRERENLSVINLRNIYFEKDLVIIRICDLSHDKNICTIQTLQCHILSPKDIRGVLKGLFVTTTKPYWEVPSVPVTPGLDE